MPGKCKATRYWIYNIVFQMSSLVIGISLEFLKRQIWIAQDSRSIFEAPREELRQNTYCRAICAAPQICHFFSICFCRRTDGDIWYWMGKYSLHKLWQVRFIQKVLKKPKWSKYQEELHKNYFLLSAYSKKNCYLFGFNNIINLTIYESSRFYKSEIWVFKVTNF